MFITNREKTIIELLIKTGGRHTSLSMATYLQVSVRTVHRDLKKIEKTLNHFDLRLVQKDNDSLHIEGPDKAVFSLAQTLSKLEPLDLSMKERKLLLLLQLLKTNEPIKTGPLAKDLSISVTTMQTYLDDLADWIEDFGVVISRKRGVGILLDGSESAKRKALANFYLLFFNEEMIEAIFQLSGPIPAKESQILHYFKQDYLWKIDQAIKQNIGSMYTELADSDYVGFLIQFCITVQRYESGFALENGLPIEPPAFGQQEGLPIVEKISQIISKQLSVELPGPEKNFLAMILKGSRLQNAESVYFDSVITGRAIKKLILQVSKQLNVDLTGDFSLFQGLMAHLEPSLFRIRKNLAAYNPLTEQVKAQYSALFAVMANCLKQVFTKIDFPDDEIAYVVLHFGSALEQRKQDEEVHVLVVCPTGIGASKMLATRLNKEFPEFSSVSIASISAMNQMDLTDYDLILSTVHLPKQSIPCVFVNPLLSKEDIEDIHSVLQSLTSRRKTMPTPFSGAASSDVRQSPKNRASSLKRFLDELDLARVSIQEILDHFSVQPMQHAETMQQVIRSATDHLFNQTLVGDPDTVYQKLIAREKLAGLAIPDTNMALFHCTDPSIQTIIFQIVHSDCQFMLRGMDGSKLAVSNFLILLAPEPMDAARREVIGTISSSFVEDRESTLIFASANEKVIHSKLEDIFYRFLVNKFSKD